MLRYGIIPTLLLLAAMLLAGTHVRADRRRPAPWLRDSIAVAATHDSLEHRGSERNDRLYDSIRSKSNRRTVPRMLYRLLFVRPRLDTTRNGQVVDESSALAPYAGRTVGSITIERRKPFDPGGNWLERTGNKLHAVTNDPVIRRDLLFGPGDRLDPQTVVRNKQLLRSRSYIADVDIEVMPDPRDSSVVDLLVITRDRWTISADGALRSEGRTMAALSDANVFGTGNRMEVRTNFSRKDFSYGGNMVELEMPNLGGSFYSARLEAGRNFYESTFDISLLKEFLLATDYELGISYLSLKNRRTLLESGLAVPVREHNLDIRAGYSHYIPSIRSSLFLTARYNYLRFPVRPASDPGSEALVNPAFHGHDLLLAGAGLYREKFYSASMVYGFGTREYLATGYKAEIVGGHAWGEFGNDLYLGVGFRQGGFCRAGYIMGSFSLGSYIDPRTGAWSRSAADADLRWFSNLFVVRRSRIRQFLGLNYTQGWNRLRGNDERIRFTDENGLRALDEVVYGINRAILNTETVLFTPYQPLGFRIALFGFVDCGLIGYAANMFRNDFFASLGLGVRLRNERMVFNTIQIRLGIAFDKHGMASSDYFRLSNTTHLEQYRYRPTRPQIAGFE